MIAGDPIFVSREGNRDASVAAAAQTFATELEALIRHTPHCWYQFYPYWAAQTEGYRSRGTGGRRLPSDLRPRARGHRFRGPRPVQRRRAAA